MPRALASTHPLAAFSVVGFYPTRPCACGAHADLHEWGDGNTLIGMALVLRIRIHVINADVDSGVLPPVEVPAMFGDEYAAEGEIWIALHSDLHYESTVALDTSTFAGAGRAWQPPAAGSARSTRGAPPPRLRDDDDEPRPPRLRHEWRQAAARTPPAARSAAERRVTARTCANVVDAAAAAAAATTTDADARVEAARRERDVRGMRFTNWGRGLCQAVMNELAPIAPQFVISDNSVNVATYRAMLETALRDATHGAAALAAVRKVAADADVFQRLKAQRAQDARTHAARRTLSHQSEAEQTKRRARRDQARRDKDAAKQQRVACVPNGNVHELPPEAEWPKLNIGPLGGHDGTCTCNVCRAWLFHGEAAQCCLPLDARSGTPAFLPPEVRLDNDAARNVQLRPLHDLYFGDGEDAEHFRKITRSANIAHSYGSMVCDKERQRRFARFLKGKPRFIIKGELYFRLKPSLHFTPSDLLKVRARLIATHTHCCCCSSGPRFPPTLMRARSLRAGERTDVCAALQLRHRRRHAARGGGDARQAIAHAAQKQTRHVRRRVAAARRRRFVGFGGRRVRAGDVDARAGTLSRPHRARVRHRHTRAAFDAAGAAVRVRCRAA
jgi:hypothetical protein